jgi:type IV pilus assembly protein PilM
MAGSKAAWGVEVGSYAVKAIRLERSGDQLVVSDFGEIRHKRPLSTPDLDVDEAIRLTLGQLVSQKNIENETLVMSVEGRSSLPRFAKLPPADKKALPKLIEFEAVQQIPFPIEEVEWDAKTFESEDSPEVEVGIFAIKKDVIDHRLAMWSEHGLNPKAITLGPVAVYNAVRYDLAGAGRKPFVVLDIGTRSSDLVVVDGENCWIRTFPIGGSDFTEAIAETFKLPYSKAERLKQESATSKYAKQIMQAMRPVFGDLLEGVQRSISFYENSHRGVKLETVLGVGSTFKIPGLRKFLGAQLGLNVARFDEFRRLQVEGRLASDFASQGVSMATAYGLALQGLDEASIEVNLTPSAVLRDQAWAAKTKWFVGAAMIAVAASGLMFVPALSAQNSMGAGTVRGKAEVDSVLALAKRQKSELDRISGEANVGFRAANFERLLEDRDVWPNLVNDAMNAIAAAGPQPELLGSDLRRIKAIDAGDRRLVLLEDLSGAYAVEGQDRFVRVQMELAFSNDSTNPPTAFINDTVGRYLNGLAAEGQRAGVPYLVVPESFSSNPGDLQQVTVAADGSSSRTSASPSGAGRGSAGSGVGTPGSFGGGGGLGAGGGSTGSSGGGQPGKRRPGGNIIDPNADPTGMGNSGGGFVPGSSSGGGGSGFGGSGSSGGGWNAGRSTGSGTGDSRSDDGLNIESEAPIPGEPSLYAEGDVFHVARVTFTVKLIDPQETSPDA